ncbi:MAG: hypothetical protein AB1758_16740 [Candidatus Eremiobacterota bacterium]
MQVASASPTATNPIKRAVRWLDEYTSPRANTAGNFKEANYFQATFQGATEGFYLMGPMGVLAGAGSAVAGSFVQNKTGNQLLGVLTGTAMGAGLGAAAGAFGGTALGTAAILGGLLGGFQTIRSHGQSSIRDAGGNATMISAFFMDGPSKIAGGIGAAAGAKCKNPWAKALMGAAVGAATGATLAAVGFAPVSVTMAAAGCGLAGAVGPFFGPRFSQFFRNVAEDAGMGIDKVQSSITDRPMSEKTRNAVGAVPAAFVKEGLRGFMYSDGGLSGFIIGGTMESIQQAHIMFFSQKEEKQNQELGDQTARLAAQAA